MKPARLIGLAVLALSALPQTSLAANPEASPRKGGHPAENNCTIATDGKSLFCVTEDPEIADRAASWTDDAIARLRAKPDLSEEDQAMLKELESFQSSGTDTVIRVTPLPH